MSQVAADYEVLWLVNLDDLLWLIDQVEKDHGCEPPMTEVKKMGYIFDMQDVRIAPDQIIIEEDE